MYCITPPAPEPRAFGTFSPRDSLASIHATRAETACTGADGAWVVGGSIRPSQRQIRDRRHACAVYGALQRNRINAHRRSEHRRLFVRRHRAGRQQQHRRGQQRHLAHAPQGDDHDQHQQHPERQKDVQLVVTHLTASPRHAMPPPRRQFIMLSAIETLAQRTPGLVYVQFAAARSAHARGRRPIEFVIIHSAPSPYRKVFRSPGHPADTTRSRQCRPLRIDGTVRFWSPRNSIRSRPSIRHGTPAAVSRARTPNPGVPRPSQNPSRRSVWILSMTPSLSRDASHASRGLLPRAFTKRVSSTPAPSSCRIWALVSVGADTR